LSDPLGTQRVYEALLEARVARRPCVLVTVLEFKGSTPRKLGAKMLVLDDGQTIGTVGGGALEHALTGEAIEMLTSERDPTITTTTKHLTHELGMCCGGGVTVLMEPQVYAPTLLLFGAGHVAEPLARIAAMADFEVIVVDERAELATQERFPSASQVLCESFEDVIDELRFDAKDTFAVIVTHDHGLDERIAREVLRRDFRFLGVIGSSRKREMFRKRLAAAGIPDEAIDRMQTPVGVDINAETPAEIAVSIVAELVRVRRDI